MADQKRTPAYLRGRDYAPDPQVVRDVLTNLNEDSFDVSLVRSRSNTVGVGCFKAIPGVTIMFPFIVEDSEDGIRVLKSYDIATKLNASVSGEIRDLLEGHRDEITTNLAAAIKKGLN